MTARKDVQAFLFRCKAEGSVPHGISDNSFCVNQGAPYRKFLCVLQGALKSAMNSICLDSQTSRSVAQVNASRLCSRFIHPFSHK